MTTNPVSARPSGARPAGAAEAPSLLRLRTTLSMMTATAAT